MNISCRKTKCKFNKNYSCTSKNIFITKNLNCAYYEPIIKEHLEDTSKTMFEIAPEIAPFVERAKVKIICEADCVFKKDNICKCNGIFVNGEDSAANDKKESIVKDEENNANQNQNIKEDKNKKAKKKRNFADKAENDRDNKGNLNSGLGLENGLDNALIKQNQTNDINDYICAGNCKKCEANCFSYVKK